MNDLIFNKKYKKENVRPSLFLVVFLYHLNINSMNKQQQVPIYEIDFGKYTLNYRNCRHPTIIEANRRNKSLPVVTRCNQFVHFQHKCLQNQNLNLKSQIYIQKTKNQLGGQAKKYFQKALVQKFTHQKKIPSSEQKSFQLNKLNNLASIKSSMIMDRKRQQNELTTTSSTMFDSFIKSTTKINQKEKRDSFSSQYCLSAPYKNRELQRQSCPLVSEDEKSIFPNVKLFPQQSNSRSLNNIHHIPTDLRKNQIQNLTKQKMINLISQKDYKIAELTSQLNLLKKINSSINVNNNKSNMNASNIITAPASLLIQTFERETPLLMHLNQLRNLLCPYCFGIINKNLKRPSIKNT